MGIDKAATSLFYELRETIPFTGRAVQLGRQDTYVTPQQLRLIAAKFGFKTNIKDNQEIDDLVLFKELGFSEISSIDGNDYEDADIIHDFNLPIPNELRNSFDMVFDGGTLEHVFDIRQSLENMCSLLRPNGLAIHLSPSHNHVDHGFYMFSPTLFYDYYTENGFRILKSELFEYEPDRDPCEWVFYDYPHPGSINHLGHGGWGEKVLMTWFVAQKTQYSVYGKIPQQSGYKEVWARHDQPPNISSTPTASENRGYIRGLKNIVKKHQFLYKFAKYIYHTVFSPRHWFGKLLFDNEFQFVMPLRRKISPPFRPPVIKRY